MASSVSPDCHDVAVAIATDNKLHVQESPDNDKPMIEAEGLLAAVPATIATDAVVAGHKETTGPRVGISLSLDQANHILQRHFGPSCECTLLEYVDRGYNNRTYIAKVGVGAGSSDEVIVPDQVIIRLCGHFWDRWKTEREVATILYLRFKCPKIPVPEVYGFCSNADKSGIGCEYILMEKLPGVPLEYLWHPSKAAVESLQTQKRELNTLEREQILDQLADILSNLQKLTFDQIGSLQLVSKLGDTYGIGLRSLRGINECDIELGPESDIMSGPFNTYEEYETSAIKSALADMKNSTFMATSLDLVPRIEHLLTKFSSISPADKPDLGDAVNQHKICLVHGDFEPRNILIDPITLQITGILDWEFAGAYPYYADWFAGFEFVGANVDERWAFGEAFKPPRHADSPGSSNSSSSTGSIEYDPNSEEMKFNRSLFIQSLKKFGLASPDEIPNLRFYAEMLHFRWNISPWWFNEATTGDDDIPGKWEKDKAYARLIVEHVLDKYGV